MIHDESLVLRNFAKKNDLMLTKLVCLHEELWRSKKVCSNFHLRLDCRRLGGHVGTVTQHQLKHNLIINRILNIGWCLWSVVVYLILELDYRSQYIAAVKYLEPKCRIIYQIFVYARCITPKRVTSLRGRFHVTAPGQHSFFRRIVATVGSRWQKRVWFDRPEIWTRDLPLQRGTR